ncbi:hypothetical protein OLMES_2286 [Oleiphilus messinensis]|uniref:PilZ domain-containing protein n=1 Tax=Oleiphilus messinensis TaxID=141451 RepID=A0A1Y0I825_9GAMM|nr:hypothetical protein [Oleiphilus messinensis]ARU56349.1 hypothetical protein OLMES_2286 [Oleiphilus messinensis]
MQQQQDRRRRQRLPWVNLSAKVKIKKTMFSSIWMEVKPFDFNQLGMGMTTTGQFEIGDTLAMTLVLNLDVGEMVVEDLPAIVRRKEQKAGLIHYGVEFDQSARFFKKAENVNNLDKLEQMLSRHSKIVDRIKDR